jgi:hypothetical protein
MRLLISGKKNSEIPPYPTHGSLKTRRPHSWIPYQVFPKQAYLPQHPNQKESMNIGLDIDGTISENPQFFALLSAVLKTAGHKVYIISYRDPSPKSVAETKQELKSWKISYDALHLPNDDFGMGMGMGEWKRDVAERLNLDIMIDDALEVLAAMPKKVLRMWVVPEDVL